MIMYSPFVVKVIRFMSGPFAGMSKVWEVIEDRLETSEDRKTMKLLTTDEINDFILECDLLYANTLHTFSRDWQDIDDVKRNMPINLEAGYWHGELASPLIGGQYVVCKDYYFNNVGYSIYRISDKKRFVRAGIDRCATMTYDQAVELAVILANRYR